jgi:hypothetical protein
MPVLNSTAANDAIVKAAQDVPTLLAGLAIVDPDLAKQLTGKPLVQSTAPIGPLIGLGVGWFVQHYGLACTAAVATGCWTESTTNAVSAGVLIVATALGAYIGRTFASAPIKGWFSKPVPVVPDKAAAIAAMQAVATPTPPAPTQGPTP